jgi:hypothetical protein
MVADNAAGVCTVVTATPCATIGTTPQVSPAAVIVNVTVPDDAAVYLHSNVVPDPAGIVRLFSGHETGVTLAQPGFTYVVAVTPVTPDPPVFVTVSRTAISWPTDTVTGAEDETVRTPESWTVTCDDVTGPASSPVPAFASVPYTVVVSLT